jgi:peptide/nickel transport system permease protein
MSNKSYRKEKLQFRLYNLKKNWRLFYNSKYGKVGFYIVLIFVVLALISPLIIQHSDPLIYTAPEGEFTVADRQLSSKLPVTVSGISASSSSSDGVYLVYTASDSGIYGVDVCNGTSYHLYHSSTPVNNITAITAENSLESAVYTYVIANTSGNLLIGKTTWSSGVEGHGTPTMQVTKIPMNNVTGIFTSGFTDHSLEVNIEYDVAYYAYPNYPVYIYTISHNTTGYYLNQYYMYNLLDTKSYGPEHSIKLPYNIKPTNYEFDASGFSSSAEVFVSQGNHFLGYTTAGKLETSITLKQNINNIYIPSAYKSSNNSYNRIFVQGNTSIYSINTFNDSESMIFNITNRITTVSSTGGSTGFPSYVLVGVSNKTMYILDKPNSVLRTMSLPVNINRIDVFLDNFLLNNDTGAYIFLPADHMASGSYVWSLSLNNGSSPLFFANPSSGGRESFAVSHGDNISIYSTAGKDLNPLPPTLTPVGGNSILPLGTTAHGNDAWSQFIGSFLTDIEIGITVGIGILLISLAIGMLIGYFAGIVSAGFETLSLAIYLIPSLPLLIVVAAIVGPSLTGIILVLTLLSWPFAAFTLIGIVRSLKNRAFVDSAKVSGAGTFQILKDHMLKNVTPILVYLTAINIGGAVAAVSTLQVLGIAPLTVPTWGGMLDGFYSDAFALALAPWWFMPPIIAITLFILAFIFISRGMDNVVNPRIGGRR